MNDEPIKDNPAESGRKSVRLNMDDIMKILFNLSDELTIRMINSLFKKNLPHLHHSKTAETVVASAVFRLYIG